LLSLEQLRFRVHHVEVWDRSKYGSFRFIFPIVMTSFE